MDQIDLFTYLYLIDPCVMQVHANLIYNSSISLILIYLILIHYS